MDMKSPESTIAACLRKQAEWCGLLGSSLYAFLLEQAVASPLFGVSNHHTDDCGPAPSVDGDEAGKYYGYFANQFAGQAVSSTITRPARRLSGWATPIGITLTASWTAEWRE